jgi:hypothetical protein
MQSSRKKKKEREREREREREEERKIKRMKGERSSIKSLKVRSYMMQNPICDPLRTHTSFVFASFLILDFLITPLKTTQFLISLELCHLTLENSLLFGQNTKCKHRYPSSELQEQIQY